MEKILGAIEPGERADNIVTVDSLMDLIMKITTVRSSAGLTTEDKDWLEKVFKDNLGADGRMNLEQFRKLVPCKNEFFVERAFRIFDKDGSGAVSLAEFVETTRQFAWQGDDEKISFLFKIFDLKNEGLSLIHI